jgi:hypothetical protein
VLVALCRQNMMCSCFRVVLKSLDKRRSSSKYYDAKRMIVVGRDRGRDNEACCLIVSFRYKSDAFTGLDVSKSN